MASYVLNFIWLPDVIEKLAIKHYLIQEEVEEIFFNHSVTFVIRDPRGAL
ncbi:MAG: hypothetical protein N0A15_02460 [Anaerolineae bacterium]|nr:hypothetical protein [Anaerolineae bacterium]